VSASYIPEDELSKRETNDLFRLVEQSNFPAIEFDLAKLEVSKSVEVEVETPSRLPSRRPAKKKETRILTCIATIVCHRPTKSYFAVSKAGAPISFLFQYRRSVSAGYPEEVPAGELYPYSDLIEWDKICSRFGEWLDGIRKYIVYMDEPDLWGRLGALRAAMADTGFDNTPFTLSEQNTISARIKEAKEYIRTSGELTNEQISQVDARLDHAEEASERIGRKDWLMMVTGSILGLVLTDTVTPQVAGHIFTLVVQGLNHLFGYGGPPPQLP
jgi:hypothetical protein